MLEVIPTLFRRLYRNWKLAFESDKVKTEFYRRYHPVPEFIPKNLTSELSIPRCVLRYLLQIGTIKRHPTICPCVKH